MNLNFQKNNFLKVSKTKVNIPKNLKTDRKTPEQIKNEIKLINNEDNSKKLEAMRKLWK